MRAVALAATALLAGTGVTSPSALLTDDVPSGFELADGAAGDLTFADYAPRSPDAVAHVDPASAEAQAMTAAVDVWTAGADDILVREITLWPDAEAASQFVERAVVVSIEDELRPVDPPFAGGIAFVGDDAGLRTRTLTWQQGPYAMAVSHFAANASMPRVIDATAEALAASVEDGTGNEIFDSGLTPDVDLPADSSDETNGGMTFTTMVAWITVIGVCTAVFISTRRRRRLAGRGAYERTTGTAPARPVPAERDVDETPERVGRPNRPSRPEGSRSKRDSEES